MQSFLRYLLLGAALSENGARGGGGGVIGSERQQGEWPLRMLMLPPQCHKAHLCAEEEHTGVLQH